MYGAGAATARPALAAQVFYPEDYNGGFAACPDPIDFRAYMTVDIYDDANAYYYTEVDEFFEAERHMRDHLGYMASGEH